MLSQVFIVVQEGSNISKEVSQVKYGSSLLKELSQLYITVV